MKDWTYGNFARFYDMDQNPIKIGTGMVKVHDLMNEMPDWFAPDVIFSDPPCNQGNLQSFSTKAGTGRLTENAYDMFEKRLMQVFDKVNPRAIYLEVFRSNFDFWFNYMEEKFDVIKVSKSYYYNKKSNKCWIISGTYNDIDLKLDFDYVDEEDVIKEICKNLPDNFSIGDPCMGMGLVGFYANYYKKRFFGTELNKHRLAYMIERIMQNTLTPQQR